MFDNIITPLSQQRKTTEYAITCCHSDDYIARSNRDVITISHFHTRHNTLSAVEKFRKRGEESTFDLFSNGLEDMALWVGLRRFWENGIRDVVDIINLDVQAKRQSRFGFAQQSPGLARQEGIESTWREKRLQTTSFLGADKKWLHPWYRMMPTVVC